MSFLYACHVCVGKLISPCVFICVNKFLYLFIHLFRSSIYHHHHHHHHHRRGRGRRRRRHHRRRRRRRHHYHHCHVYSVFCTLSRWTGMSDIKYETLNLMSHLDFRPQYGRLIFRSTLIFFQK
jgi:hypothetical protein